MKQRHIPVPDYQNYFAQKFTAVIGGKCQCANDITDKILLANSLLDHASQVFFVGEIGLVALHALGIATGKVDRFSEDKYQLREFDECKD